MQHLNNITITWYKRVINTMYIYTTHIIQTNVLLPRVMKWDMRGWKRMTATCNV